MGRSTKEHCHIFITPEQYINEKLNMLRKDFRILPTRDEIRRLESCKTEISIDNVVKSIILHHLEDEEEK